MEARPLAGEDGNRRASRVFLSGPESYPMGASAPGVSQAKTGSNPKANAQAGAWGAHGKARGGQPLRLLGSLRGEGALVWSGGSILADYELDLFSRGPVIVASGNLEGDFSSLLPDDENPLVLTDGSRLRLMDGRVLKIGLVTLESGSADFDAYGASINAGLLEP